MGGIAGDRRRLSRLFIRIPGSANSSSTLMMPNRLASSIGISIAPTTASAFFGDQPMEHFHIVHLVDMIAGQDEHIFRLFGVEQKQVLIDRISGAVVPFFADPLLRRNRGDVFTEFGVKMFQPVRMWRSSEWDLYWIRTATFRSPDSGSC